MGDVGRMSRVHHTDALEVTPLIADPSPAQSTANVGSSVLGVRRMVLLTTGVLSFALLVFTAVPTYRMLISVRNNDSNSPPEQMQDGVDSSSEDVFRTEHLNLVVASEAASKGAVCLDGSAPGYYFRPGSGTGKSSWIIFMQGGGWCYSLESCLSRSRGSLGSSHAFMPSLAVEGLFSSRRSVNPDFHNWNVAYLAYCDGASFAGDVATPVVVVVGRRLDLDNPPFFTDAQKSAAFFAAAPSATDSPQPQTPGRACPLRNLST
eukprot:jgi/Mesen1/9766/ME000007S09834